MFKQVVHRIATGVKKINGTLYTFMFKYIYIPALEENFVPVSLCPPQTATRSGIIGP